MSSPLPGWRLVWCDEFDGSELDRTRWEPQLGNGFFHGPERHWVPGWGNGELQYYTADRANLEVVDSCLCLRALREERESCAYTSARLRTRTEAGEALFAQRYGRFEARVKAPTGRGLWSAVWMLPQGEVYGPWPASGEIDLLEIVGDRPGEYLGSLHFGASFPQRSHVTHTHGFPEGQGVDGFHDYALEWDPGEIRWFVDGELWASQAAWWSCSRREGARGVHPRGPADLNVWPAPFDQPFHLLVNLAVGGGLPGAPDASTAFPAEMKIDYIRVYEREP